MQNNRIADYKSCNILGVLSRVTISDLDIILFCFTFDTLLWLNSSPDRLHHQTYKHAVSLLWLLYTTIIKTSDPSTWLVSYRLHWDIFKRHSSFLLPPSPCYIQLCNGHIVTPKCWLNKYAWFQFLRTVDWKNYPHPHPAHAGREFLQAWLAKVQRTVRIPSLLFSVSFKLVMIWNRPFFQS